MAENKVLLADERELRRAADADYGRLLERVLWARLYRAAASERGLFERMVELWTDHFNVSIPDLLVEKVVRKHTLAQLYRTGAERELSDGAAETLRTVGALAAVAEDGYTPAAGATYPESPFGGFLKQVAQLIKAEVGLEVACVDAGGWDTHEEQSGADGWLADWAA